MAEMTRPPDIISNDHVVIKYVWLLGPGDEQPPGTLVSATHLPGYRLAWTAIKEAHDGTTTTFTATPRTLGAPTFTH